MNWSDVTDSLITASGFDDTELDLERESLSKDYGSFNCVTVVSRLRLCKNHGGCIGNEYLDI